MPNTASSNSDTDDEGRSGPPVSQKKKTPEVATPANDAKKEMEAPQTADSSGDEQMLDEEDIPTVGAEERVVEIPPNPASDDTTAQEDIQEKKIDDTQPSRYTSTNSANPAPASPGPPDEDSDSGNENINFNLRHERPNVVDIEKDVEAAREEARQKDVESTIMGANPSKMEKEAKKSARPGGQRASKKGSRAISEVSGHVDSEATTRTYITRVTPTIWVELPSSALLHAKMSTEEGQKVREVEIPLAYDKMKGPSRRQAVNAFIDTLKQDELRNLVYAIRTFSAQTLRRNSGEDIYTEAIGAWVWARFSGKDSDMEKERAVAAGADPLFLLSNENMDHLASIARKFNILPENLWPDSKTVKYASINGAHMVDCPDSEWKFWNAETDKNGKGASKASAKRSRKSSADDHTGASRNHETDEEEEEDAAHITNTDGEERNGTEEPSTMRGQNGVSNNGLKLMKKETIWLPINKSVPSVMLATNTGPNKAKRVKVTLSYYDEQDGHEADDESS